MWWCLTNFSVPCPRTKHPVDSPKQLVCKIFQTSARLFKIFANVLLIDGKCRNIPDFHFCQTFYFFKASGRFFKTSKNLANKLITSARHRRRSRFWWWRQQVVNRVMLVVKLVVKLLRYSSRCSGGDSRQSPPQSSSGVLRRMQARFLPFVLPNTKLWAS